MLRHICNKYVQIINDRQNIMNMLLPRSTTDANPDSLG